MNFRKLLTILAAATLAHFGCSRGEPDPPMLQAGGTTVTIADGQVGPPADSNPGVGAVTYIGGVGGWTHQRDDRLGSVPRNVRWRARTST